VRFIAQRIRRRLKFNSAARRTAIRMVFPPSRGRVDRGDRHMASPCDFSHILLERRWREEGEWRTAKSSWWDGRGFADIEFGAGTLRFWLRPLYAKTRVPILSACERANFLRRCGTGPAHIFYRKGPAPDKTRILRPQEQPLFGERQRADCGSPVAWVGDCKWRCDGGRKKPAERAGFTEAGR